MSSTPDSSADHAYFHAIEETFIRLRGAPLLLSPDDWQLARSWRQDGVPLALVLSTLEELFAARRERGAKDPIRGLRYCRSAVESAWAQHSEWTATGTRRAPTAIDVGARLEALSAQLSTCPQVSPTIGNRVRKLVGPPEEVERALIELDREMVAQARDHLDSRKLEQIESSVEPTVRSLGSRVDPEQIDKVRSRLLREAIRRHYGLPVLSLFSVATSSE